MSVFQPTEISIKSQQIIELIFSSEPSLFISKGNFLISSTFSGVPDLEILKIEINSFTITITARPMFPDNLYLLKFIDLPTQIFEDIHNVELSTLSAARQIYFVGVQDINIVRDKMLQNLPPNYDTGDQTLVRDITTTIANEINIASITLEEIKNDNFLSIEVVDELYFRGHGPSDRLQNEGAYEISRVAKTTTATYAAGLKTFDPISDPNIPFEIINLRVIKTDEIVPNNKSTNKFDGFLITASNHNITKLLSVELTPGNMMYDPSKHGYALLNNDYDRFARPSPILQNNQILLSSLTNGDFPEPIPGDTLNVVYEFDNSGRRVDGSSILLFTILKQTDEMVPASVTNYFLSFANIVNEDGQAIVLGGVDFNLSNINLNKHQAFLHEIIFNPDSLPSAPGEYAINYLTGQVFVFGTQTQIGSGNNPPVATYFYKNIATSNVDYFISDDGYNVSLNPFSQFAFQKFTITFLYEDVFAPDVDYLITSHNEVLNERVNNRLISDFGIRVNNGPVKDIYEIRNETTGEVYTPGLIEMDNIFFTGNTPPAVSTSLGELARAGVIDDEILAVGIPTTTPNGLLRVFPVALRQSPLLNQRQDGIGSNFNTSIQFTRPDLFQNEFYFNNFETISRNIGKFRSIGDYLVDYLNGNIYLAVTNNQIFDIGHISYAYGVFIPTHAHVLGVSNISLGTTSTHIIKDFELANIEDGIIFPKNLNYGYDLFDGITRVPNSNFIFVAQLQDDFTVYTKYPIKKVYGVYTQNDVDAYSSEGLVTKNLFNGSVNSFNNTVIDLKTYAVLSVQADVNPNYYHIIIPDNTTLVKSIVVVDTGAQLLDTQLYIIKYKNIIIKNVVASFGIATLTLQNIISMNQADVGLGADSLVDIAGNRFVIIGVSGISTPPNIIGNIITVSYSGSAPLTNIGSQILDHNGIIVANHLNIISVTELPDLLYILHYDVFPLGILPGYQAKDTNGNIFTITDVQTSSVVVSVLSDLPVVDPVARIETESILQANTPSVGQTTLLLPLDAPIELIFVLQDGTVTTDGITAAIVGTGTNFEPTWLNTRIQINNTDTFFIISVSGQTLYVSTIPSLVTNVPFGISLGGTNLQIGYVPTAINNSIIAANVNSLSAGGAGMVIDYSIGQYFIDYNHLDDELLISYDWGDNQLNWSISDSLYEGEPYYVSYKYGASRDGLETNFGPLTNVNFLQNAPLSISREIYRTAVSAAIKAFLKGPTHEAIRLLSHAFTQIDPDIQEAILNEWVVGRDPLSLQEPNTTGSIVFGNGKYGEGLVITDDNSIQVPGASSIKLTRGTFSTWFRPNWSGSEADEDIIFNLPSALHTVYYNAHMLMPQDVPTNPWYMKIDSDSYGTAYVNSGYLEINNSRNEYITGSYPSNSSYSIINIDGYDGYETSSTFMIHDAFTDFPYIKRIGTYAWYRTEEILSVANDLDINLSGHVYKLNYVNPVIDIIKVMNASIDDGYSKYDTGFYLFKKNLYTTQVILEDVHLTIVPPYPHINPPIIVSTIIGSNIATVITGDTSTLSIGQQIIIGTAYPSLTNIMGFSANIIILRSPALATLSNIEVSNLDPPSHNDMQDGYGEIHLQDKLGIRNNITDERINGWERQLLVKLQLSPFSDAHLMVIGSNDAPLSTQSPVIDFGDSITPGIDVLVDGYGNVFEIDKVTLPYIWAKKPSASDVSIPIGTSTIFRKVVGVKLPDATLLSTPLNWTLPASCSMQKRSGVITLFANQLQVSESYVSHCYPNSSGTSEVVFGQIDINVDAIVRLKNMDYSIHSIFTLNDVYIGNTGNNPTTDTAIFKYDASTTGAPAIASDKYFAIFTDKLNSATDEPDDEVFVKIKIPSSWTLDDGINNITFTAIPIIHFSTDTAGDVIDIVDGYGLSYYKTQNNVIKIIATDTSTYIPGHATILMDGGPELRLSAGKKHYLLDVESAEGALRLYRSGTGFLIAEVETNNSAIYNIRSNISDWMAGQLHHIAMSWKINSPDETDELHLFIDGDEMPNEITFGSGIKDGYIGQIYKEVLIPIPRVASTDGYIVNDVNGSGIYIPYTATVQPSTAWINKTIVLNATTFGPNVYLNEPLIVGTIVAVVGGNMLFLSQYGKQIDFSIYGPSTPILYGLATSIVAETTILVHTNFAVFKNSVELDGPNSTNPQFRQVGDTQVVELYDIDSSTNAYIENISFSDVVSIKTYGLLTQRIKSSVYQYGSLIRSNPVIIDILQSDIVTNVDVAINDGGPAFITDLPAPVDILLVQATKILLPRIIL